MSLRVADEKVLKDLVKIRKEIKEKYRALRNNETQSNSFFQDTFKPIIEPLQTLVKQTKNIYKPEKTQDTSYQESYEALLPLAKKRKLGSKNTSTPLKPEVENGKEKNDFEDESSIFKPLSKSTEFNSLGANASNPDTFHDSIDEMNNTFKRMKSAGTLDSTYGPHWDAKNKKWKIGDSEFEIQNNNIVIGNETYQLTEGLRQLLFYQSPSGYVEADLPIYKNILVRTNAYRRYYRSNSQIQSSRLAKYSKIIRPFFVNELKSAKKGSGFMQLSKQKPVYVYWNDPNELVDRLRLLISSQQAGHTNHNNEIASIIEELRENDIIL